MLFMDMLQPYMAYMDASFGEVHAINLSAFKTHIDVIMKDYHKNVYAKLGFLILLTSMWILETNNNLGRFIHRKEFVHT